MSTNQISKEILVFISSWTLRVIAYVLKIIAFNSDFRSNIVIFWFIFVNLGEFSQFIKL